ncbi:hypothetical protein [Mesorhizobium sp. M0118]|uniref:hypothetical protein n=1 Tax=Mesorhizobium sp. M0118 TaxID=2956884 RepID=UPI00333768B2
MYKALIGTAAVAIIVSSAIYLHGAYAASRAAEAAQIAAICAHAKERLASIDVTNEDRSVFIACGLRDAVRAAQADSWEPIVRSEQELSVAGDLKDAW